MPGRNRRRNEPADPRLPPRPADRPRARRTARYIEIRGGAGLVTDGALEHLDRITRKYAEHPRYYGYIYPLEQQERGRRVICRIHARKITLDAIHS